MIGYKGFDSNWKCRAVKFNVGETVQYDGKLELCQNRKKQGAVK